MSRFFLNNSSALQHVAAATGSSTSKCKAPSHVVRRWKSLLHLNYKRQLQQQRETMRIIGTTAAGSNRSSQGEAISVRGLQTSAATSSFAVPSSSSCSVFQASTSRAAPLQLQTTRNMSKKESSTLNLENINPNFICMEYAVRGPLVIRAGAIENELKEGAKKPFTQVIRANIGDAHAMGQEPITFVRQLLAVCTDNTLLDSPNYPDDVKERARAIIAATGGNSIGSYTDSAGIAMIRQQVAEFIKQRDGIEANWNNIYLTGGATPGIKSILALLNCPVDGKKPCIMVPIPQYPLYSATIAEYGMATAPYYLDEENKWGLDVKELKRAYDENKATCATRCLVVINPGNPTGQVLTRENIVEIVKFAYEHKLFLIADEVYQYNIWDKDSKFYSFRKVVEEMGEPYRCGLEFASFNSASKGFLGECGIRGGYMEICNMQPEVQAMLTKSLTASLCSTTAGQIAISALVNPPKPSEPSYEKFMCERDETLKSLKERADLLYKTFSSMEGFKINPLQGAMYGFPQLLLPQKAIEAAKAKNMPADTFYAFELLEATGICIISGSGFGQRKGTYHFRTTILPQKDKLLDMMKKITEFHTDFLKRYK